MSKKSTELVPTYKPGEDQNGTTGLFTERVECHRQKKLNLGHFARHGTVFQLDGPPKEPAPPAVSSRFGAVRDESVSPGQRVTIDYVARERYAVAIIDIGWMRRPHGQEVQA